MNMHELQHKYRKSSDFLEVQRDPEYGDALLNVDLFKKGDAGIFIVPPSTRDFMYTVAMSTCTEDLNEQSDGFNVPRMNSVAYVDTLISKEEHDFNNQMATSYLCNEPSKNFHVFSKDTLYKSWQGIHSANRGEFDYFANQIEEDLNHFDCLFVNIESLLFSPLNFRKTDFDNLIKWVAKMKSQDKTIVLFSRYQLPHTEYLSRHMDFVINCIPHQRSEYFEGCAFGVQWLKKNGGKFDPINNPIYFNLMGYTAAVSKNRSWVRLQAMDFFTTYDSKPDYDFSGENYSPQWPGLHKNVFNLE
jgi:hypothetical protein